MIKCHERGMIKDNWMLIKLHDNLSEYAMLNGTLFSYTWVNLPLVYTQLVTIAVYVYFYFVALFARINVIFSKLCNFLHKVNLYLHCSIINIFD